MNIQEAAKRSAKTGKPMFRKSKVNTIRALTFTPTNGPDCCIVNIQPLNTSIPDCLKPKAQSIPRWEPQLNDLIADDWEVTE